MSRLKLAYIAQLVAVAAAFTAIASAHGQIAPVTRQVDEVIQQRVTDQVHGQISRRVEQRVSATVTENIVDVSTVDLHSVVQQVQPDVNGLLAITNQNGGLAFNEVRLPDGSRAIEHEWLLHIDANVMDDMRAVLRQLRAQLKTAETLPALGLTVIHFRAEQDFSAETLQRHMQQAIAAADLSEPRRSRLQSAVQQTLTPHYIYAAQAAAANSAATSGSALQQKTWCQAPVKIGMVDTLIETSHPGFAKSQLVQREFVTDALTQPVAHGTAVAGLLVAQQQNFESLAPNAQLYNGAIFYRQGDLHQGAALMPLLQALNWLAEKQVKVINLSLTGPANSLLQTAVEKLSERDIVLVAAAGNDGPMAGVLYPAGYEQVLAVTAVNQQRQLYRWANQGAHIELSALGVRVMTTRHNGAVGHETGTSMAAPVVTAAAACLWAQSPQLSAQQLRQQLQRMAQDLGEKGRDPQFGYGLVATKN
jgi:hypothetical protein